MAKNWAYSESGIPYSYTIELPPSKAVTTGLDGFDLPESDILEVGREQSAGLMAMIHRLRYDLEIHDP